MTFLAPYWLFAASAVLVPIAIHLWNKRQGKTVKVGSLRWLEASASKRWSSIRLNDVWLLVLRCAILLLLATALAKPVWERAPQKHKGAKAIYIGQELLYSPALVSIKPTIDSLLQRGFTLHRYAPGFARLQQVQWQALSNNPKDSIVSNGNHWALLPALAQKHPAAQDSIWLFTSDQQRHFNGNPTALQENITWVPVALEASNAWLQAACLVGTDSIQFILGHSTRAGTTYSRTRTAFTNRSPSINLSKGVTVRLVPQGDSLSAQLQGQAQPVLVQKEPLQVSIVSNKTHQAEARYLQAALSAISVYTGLPVALRTGTTPDTTADWLFWLRNEELPESWQQRVRTYGTNVWLQPAAKPVATTAAFTAAGGPIRLHQLAAITPAEDATVAWHTSEGEPLLMVKPLGKGKIYQFRSGFSPAWSQLGQSAQLPELLLPLLLPQPAASAYDARALPEAQLKPILKPAQASIKQTMQQHDLMPWLVVAAFLLFLAERTITGKRATA